MSSENMERKPLISVTKSLLSNEKIEELLRKNFGDTVVLISAEELVDGMFNACYKLTIGNCEHDMLVLKTGVTTGKYVLTYEQGLMRTEVDVYRMLEQTEIPVPRIIAVDYSRELVDCDYFFMEYLLGDTWGKFIHTGVISPENTRVLHRELGRNTARLHTIKGNYFGYIRDDKFYRHPTWREAFRAMVDSLIQDGRRDGVELPYSAVYDTFEPLWSLLDEITEPSLVHYDMWAKNILLIKRNGQYIIDGIIDLERCFYGDPIAEYISTVTIVGNLEQAEDFISGYNEVLPFRFTENDKIRLGMYKVYMGLLVGIEIYRYPEADVKQRTAGNSMWIMRMLDELNDLITENQSL